MFIYKRLRSVLRKEKNRNNSNPSPSISPVSDIDTSSAEIAEAEESNDEETNDITSIVDHNELHTNILSDDDQNECRKSQPEEPKIDWKDSKCQPTDGETHVLLKVADKIKKKRKLLERSQIVQIDIRSTIHEEHFSINEDSKDLPAHQIEEKLRNHLDQSRISTVIDNGIENQVKELHKIHTVDSNELSSQLLVDANFIGRSPALPSSDDVDNAVKDRYTIPPADFNDLIPQLLPVSAEVVKHDMLVDANFPGSTRLNDDEIEDATLENVMNTKATIMEGDEMQPIFVDSKVLELIYSPRIPSNDCDGEYLVYEIKGTIFPKNHQDINEDMAFADEYFEFDVVNSDIFLPITIQETNRGLIINSKVFLYLFEWNTIMSTENLDGYKCIVCNIMLDDEVILDHIEDHLNILDMHKPLRKFDISIVRLINGKYHCAICNIIFEIDEDHLESFTHGERLMERTNEAMDIINELEIDTAGLNGNNNSNSTVVYNHDFELDNETLNSIRAHNHDLCLEVNESNCSRNSGKYLAYSNSVLDRDTKNLGTEDIESFETVNSNDDMPFSYADAVKKSKAKESEYVKIRLGDSCYAVVKFDSWHMILTMKSNKFYCMACTEDGPISYKTNHCQKLSHVERLQQCTIDNDFKSYVIRRVTDKLYHCSHCNNLQIRHGIKDHIATTHAKKSNSGPNNIPEIAKIDKDSKCTVVSATAHRMHSNILNDDRNVMKNVNATVSNSETLIDSAQNTNNEIITTESSEAIFNAIASLPIEDTIVIVQFGQYFRVPMLAYNLIQKIQPNNYLCTLCGVWFVDLSYHVRNPTHLINLKHTPFILEAGVHLIRLTKYGFHCTLCNIFVKIDPLVHTYDQLHLRFLHMALNSVPLLGISNLHTREAISYHNPYILNVNARRLDNLTQNYTSGRGNDNVLHQNSENRDEDESKKTRDEIKVRRVGEAKTGENLNQTCDDITKLRDDLIETGDKVTEKRDEITEVRDNLTETGIQVTEKRDEIKEGRIGETNTGENLKQTRDEITEVRDDLTETGDKVTEKGDDLTETRDEMETDDEINISPEGFVYVKIKNICKKISMVSYNCMVRTGSGALNCVLCWSEVFYVHLNAHVSSKNHRDNLKMYKFLDKYDRHLLRQISLYYHCALCNVLIAKNFLEDHLAWSTHKEIESMKPSRQIKRRDRKSGVREIVCPTEKEVVLEGPVRESNIIDNVEITEISDVMKKVIVRLSSVDEKINDVILRVTWEAYHGLLKTKSGYNCQLCETDFQSFEAIQHTTNSGHVERLHRFEMRLAPALVRKINDSTLQCITCNLKISNKNHFDGQRHAKLYQAAIFDSSLADTAENNDILTLFY